MRRLEVRPGFVFFACCLYYLFPGDIVLLFFIFSALHELGHLAALSICRVQVYRVSLGAFGAIIKTGTMGHWQEAICALAGPFMNLFSFWALHRGFPAAAFLSLLLGLYNLLPVFPLDGGVALRALLSLWLPLHLVDILSGIIGLMTLGALGVWMAVFLPGRAPLLFFAFLLFHIARERKSRYNRKS